MEGLQTPSCNITAQPVHQPQPQAMQKALTGMHLHDAFCCEVSDEAARQRSQVFLPSSEGSLTYHTPEVSAASSTGHLIYLKEPSAISGHQHL